MSDLHQSGLEVNTDTGDTHSLLLSSRFVATGSQSSPAAKPPIGTKLAHIRADFRDE